MNALTLLSRSACLPRILNRDVPGAVWKFALIQILTAATAFHVAWLVPGFECLVILNAVALVRLSELPSARLSFRCGLITGLISFAPHLAWFCNIFGWVSACLWFVLAFFTGIFALLLHVWRARFGARLLWFAAPVIWTGLEYFRSEVYYLRFSWLSVGYIFSNTSGHLPVGNLGVYGAGFLVFLVAGTLVRFQDSRLKALGVTVTLFAVLLNLPRLTVPPKSTSSVMVAGIQLEFPPDLEVPRYLDLVLREHPQARIMVLSEYSFDGPVPRRVRDWCRENARYLIAGGKDEIAPGKFYNTAFVIGPNGETVFKQGKSVPIQFFSDGLPATVRDVWHSPWGRIAIPICYDLSYRRVTDEFVKGGAQAFIVPFMDVTDWGGQQHAQHTRIGPMRAMEYQVPVFRLGSSGISQDINAAGRVLSTGEYPGQERILAGTLHLSRAGRLPLDHWLAPACTSTVFILGLYFAITSMGRFRRTV